MLLLTQPLSLSGEVRCEPPNNRLDKFKGNLVLDGQTYSLDNDKVLLRGCTLRNTEWCFGLVIFGGKFCLVLGAPLKSTGAPQRALVQHKKTSNKVIELVKYRYMIPIESVFN